MRYPKGGLNLSRDHDDPLLRQLAHSGFATRDQLFDFMHLQGCGECRRSFNWRLLRLVQHGLVRQQTVRALRTEQVYALTPLGNLHVAGIEDRFVTSWQNGRGAAEQTSILHSVELNDIQLSAARSGFLTRWMPEPEVRSENQLTVPPFYAKDYDALVTVECNGCSVTFALEYERTPKSRDEYRGIAGKMAGERHVDHILYLLTNEHLLRFVSWEFRSLQRRVYFGLAAEWHRQLLNMPAFSWRDRGYAPFHELLLA